MHIEEKYETFKASGTLGNNTMLLTPTARAFATCLQRKKKAFSYCSQKIQHMKETNQNTDPNLL